MRPRGFLVVDHILQSSPKMMVSPHARTTIGARFSDGRCDAAGDGGFFIISANATVFQSDFFVLGSLFSQCTVTSFADKTKAPIYSANCALGQPNACCNTSAGCSY